MKVLRLILLAGLFFTIAADDIPPEPTDIPIVEETIPEPTEIPIEEVTPVLEVTPEPEIPTIGGCTDSRSPNYIPSDENWKVVDDGSCYFLTGCTDPKAVNYVDFGMYTQDDGSCYYMQGCTDPDAANYVDFGMYTINDGPCYYLICNDETGCDVSYTKPHRAAKKSTPNEEVAPYFIPVELELPEYIFRLGDNLFELFLDRSVNEEVCRY